MEVAVSDLRAHLSHWIDRARDGQDVIVTERGVPVARLAGVDSTSTIERLTRNGVISTPAAPGPRPSAADIHRVKASRNIADLVSEQRP